jgi:hypothetical protein
MRTDVHHHLWPDPFRRLLERRTEPPRLRGRRLVLPRGGDFDVDASSYEPQARLAELERSGLERALISLPPTSEPTPDLVAVWQEEALALQRQTHGRLVPLAYASADPAYPGAILAAPLLSCSPELLSRLEQQNQFLFVHPTAAPPSRPGWRVAGVGYAQQMLDAYAYWLADGAARWPRLRVVFALLGGGAAFQLERLVRRGLDPAAPHRDNVWFDTSSYGERALELSLQTFGPARLLFGSDAPIDPLAAALAPTRSLGAALETTLLVDNPLELLDTREEARWAA